MVASPRDCRRWNLSVEIVSVDAILRADERHMAKFSKYSATSASEFLPMTMTLPYLFHSAVASSPLGSNQLIDSRILMAGTDNSLNSQTKQEKKTQLSHMREVVWWFLCWVANDVMTIDRCQIFSSLMTHGVTSNFYCPTVSIMQFFKRCDGCGHI